MERKQHIQKINRRLEGVSTSPGDWFEYAFALADALDEMGPTFLTHEEKLLVSACKLDTYIQSSGLFSYFELAPEWSAIGVEAMEHLGLPKLASVLTSAKKVLGVPSDATEQDIKSVATSLSEQQFGESLDQLQPLEDIYYADEAAIADAFVAYVLPRIDTLKRVVN